MSQVAEGLQYTRDHEWLRVESDGTLTVGITDHAQAALGELVYIELPAAGASLVAGDACAVVESVKAASDVYSPVTGQVVAINDALESAPELVNQSAYERGWLFRVQPASMPNALLDAAAYQQHLRELED